MTRRTQTHITDTLAIREIISKLPENWLVRGLEERDYGIDLSIELYEGENPTGCFSLIQVKGTKKPFKETVSLNGFPTKTLEYAQLFPEAFFIFHTSVDDKQTYFVWAQKYIEIRLVEDAPNWKKQDSNTIIFPEDNLLGTEEGNKKIERIMRHLAARKSGLEFLADFEWLKMHWENYKLGETKVLNNCIDISKRIQKHTAFYSVYNPEAMNVDFVSLLNSLEYFEHYPLSETREFDEDEARNLSVADMHIMALDALKMTFLGQSEMDAFEEEFSSSSPY